MKSFCYFVAIAVCLGISGVAHASSIVGFAANILDPTRGGKDLFSNSFSAKFHDCSDFSGVPSGLGGDYCFEGINATNFDSDDCKSGTCTHDSDDPAGSIWTSLTITFTDPGGILDATSCGSLDPGTDDLFGSSSCTETGGVDTLSFTGGKGIGLDDSFFIVIQAPTGVTLDDLNRLSPSDVAGVVPEPDSALLLATGTAMFGLLLYAERRRLLRQSMNS